MPRPHCLAVTALLFLPAARGAADDAKRREAWRALFAQDNPATATARIDAVVTACGSDAARLEALIAADDAYPALKPGWHRHTTRVRDGSKAYEAEFFIRIPRGYTTSKSWPVILAAHGMGNTGRKIGRSIEWLLRSGVEQFVLVAPTLPGPTGFNMRAYQIDTYLRPLAWARTHVNVDDDRMYMTGYSQGGHVTWHLSTLHAHLFAATAPVAGAPVFVGYPVTTTGYLDNLSNLPMWAIWGEKDGAPPGKEGNVNLCRRATAQLEKLRNTHYRATELKGRGHGGCWPDGRELARFFLTHKRAATPRKYSHFFHLARHSQSYYVQPIRYARPPFDFNKGLRVTLPPGAPPTQESIRRVYDKQVDRMMFRMTAELAPARNELAVRAVGVHTLRVRVIDGMFDLTRPVVLRRAGRTWRLNIPVSPRCLLTHYAATRDATALVYNEVDLSTSARPQIRFEKR